MIIGPAPTPPPHKPDTKKQKFTAIPPASHKRQWGGCCFRLISLLLAVTLVVAGILFQRQGFTQLNNSFFIAGQVTVLTGFLPLLLVFWRGCGASKRAGEGEVSNRGPALCSFGIC